jgi:hypothetical protein
VCGRSDTIPTRNTLTSNAPSPSIFVVDVGDDGTDDESREEARGVEQTDADATWVTEIFVPRIESL